MSQQGYWHIIRMNLQFQNLTNEPLIIAYREGSMVMVDNLGNTHQAAGGNPGAYGRAPAWLAIRGAIAYRGHRGPGLYPFAAADWL